MGHVSKTDLMDLVRLVVRRLGRRALADHWTVLVDFNHQGKRFCPSLCRVCPAYVCT